MATLITWPVDLNQAVLVNNTLSNDFNVIRSTVGVGPAKTRKRSTAAIKQFDCSFIMNNSTQYARFLTFIESDTNGGADSFNWKDPQTGAAAEMRFVSIGRIAHLGAGVYQVDFTMEKLA